MRPLTVHLTRKDRRLLDTKKKEKLTARARNRIDILLLADRGKTAAEVIDLLRVTADTVWRTKKKYLDHGLAYALAERRRSGQPKKYTIRQETELVAMTCSSPPEGRKRWTLILLREEMRRSAKGCKTMNRESIRLLLKKMHVSLG